MDIPSHLQQDRSQTEKPSLDAVTDLTGRSGDVPQGTEGTQQDFNGTPDPTDAGNNTLQESLKEADFVRSWQPPRPPTPCRKRRADTPPSTSPPRANKRQKVHPEVPSNYVSVLATGTIAVAQALRICMEAHGRAMRANSASATGSAERVDALVTLVVTIVQLRNAGAESLEGAMMASATGSAEQVDVLVTVLATILKASLSCKETFARIMVDLADELEDV